MMVRHCARCGKDLTDAASREAGIGPICRHLDNKVLAQMIPAVLPVAANYFAQVEKAYFPEDAHPTILLVAKALSNDEQNDWRSTVQRIEWLASFQHKASKTRALLTSTIEALGYIVLASIWKGEASTGEAVVTFEGGRLFIRGSRNLAGKIAMKKIWGRMFHSAGYGEEKAAWSVPAARHEEFRKAVMLHWPLATGLTESIEAAIAYHTAQVDAEMSKKTFAPAPVVAALPASEPAPAVEAPKVVFTKEGDYVNIASPYSGAFIAAVKALPYKDRSWNRMLKVWTIRAIHEAAIRKVAEEIYACEVKIEGTQSLFDGA